MTNVAEFPTSSDRFSRFLEDVLAQVEREAGGILHPTLRAGLNARMADFFRDAEAALGTQVLSIDTPAFLASAPPDVQAEFQRTGGEIGLKARDAALRWAAGKYLALVLEVERERVKRYSGG